MRSKFQKVVCGVLIALALIVSTTTNIDHTDSGANPQCIDEEIYVSQ